MTRWPIIRRGNATGRLKGQGGMQGASPQVSLGRAFNKIESWSTLLLSNRYGSSSPNRYLQIFFDAGQAWCSRKIRLAQES